MVGAGVGADVGALVPFTFDTGRSPLTHAMKSEGHVSVVLNPAQTLRFGWKQGWPPLSGPQISSEHPSAMVVVKVVVDVVADVVLVVIVVLVVVVLVAVVLVLVVDVAVMVVVLLNSSKSLVGHAPVSSSFSTQTPVSLFRHGPDDP